MEIMIDKLLKEQGKTRYELSKYTEISYPAIAKLCNNQTTSITFENLEKICVFLKCSAGDIFKF